MIELGWPAAAAVVASVATVIVGVFGYLSKSIPSGGVAETATANTKGITNLTALLHQKLTDVDRDVTCISNKTAMVEQKMDGLQKRVFDHEKRDIHDFETVNRKIDKLTDMIIKIISDDR